MMSGKAVKTAKAKDCKGQRLQRQRLQRQRLQRQRLQRQRLQRQKTAKAKTAKAKTAKAKTAKAKTAKAKTAKTTRIKTICISHKEDCDGISSAALIRQAFGGDTILVDYPGQMDALKQVVDDEKLKSLYICDLGLSKKTQDEFIEILSTLRKNKVSVTYIDHHDIDPNVIKGA